MEYKSWVTCSYCFFIAAELQQKSWNAEVAVIELINKFLESVPVKQIQDLRDNW